MPGVSGSLADGLARSLFDTRGRTWANVVYLGEFQPDPMGPRPAVGAGSGGWCAAVPSRVSRTELTRFREDPGDGPFVDTDRSFEQQTAETRRLPPIRESIDAVLAAA